MLADEFSRQGHGVRILTWSEKGSIKTFTYDVVRRPSLGRILAAMKWADVVFENNPCLRLSWPNLFLKKPLVVALHTWLKNVDREVGLPEKLKLAWLHKANKVIACSEALRIATFPTAITIGNPYDNELFVHDSVTQPNKEYVFLGRLVSDKGVHLAIEALKIATEQEPTLFSQTNLTIIGEGPEREPLEKLVEQIGLQKVVRFVGSKKGESLVEELNKHQYLLVPSLWQEPFGIVALEGMACGCLPIVAKSGGLPDAVGNAGEVFECGNANSLAEKMILLKKSPEYEQVLRNAATVHLQNHVSKNVALQYLQVLKSVTIRRKTRLHHHHENNM